MAAFIFACTPSPNHSNMNCTSIFGQQGARQSVIDGANFKPTAALARSIKTLPRTGACRSLVFRNRFDAPKPYLIESLAQAIPTSSGRGRRIGVHRP